MSETEQKRFAEDLRILTERFNSDVDDLRRKAAQRGINIDDWVPMQMSVPMMPRNNSSQAPSGNFVTPQNRNEQNQCLTGMEHQTPDDDRVAQQEAALRHYREELERKRAEQEEEDGRNQEEHYQRTFPERSDLRVKLTQEREKQWRELQRIVEEAGQAREETRRQFAEFERTAQEQLELLKQLRETADWSRAIEKNWEIRLKALTSTKRRVDKAIDTLRDQLIQAKDKQMDPKFVKTRMDQVRDELVEIILVMDREVKNLVEMQKVSKKKFELDIAKPLKTISNVCTEFTGYLDSQCQKHTYQKEADVMYKRVYDFQHQIYEGYQSIPTLYSLKAKHPSDFKNRGQGAMIGGDDNGFVMKIAEIE